MKSLCAIQVNNNVVQATLHAIDSGARVANNWITNTIAPPVNRAANTLGASLKSGANQIENSIRSKANDLGEGLKAAQGHYLLNDPFAKQSKIAKAAQAFGQDIFGSFTNNVRSGGNIAQDFINGFGRDTGNYFRDNFTRNIFGFNTGALGGGIAEKTISLFSILPNPLGIFDGFVNARNNLINNTATVMNRADSQGGSPGFTGFGYMLSSASGVGNVAEGLFNIDIATGRPIDNWWARAERVNNGIGQFTALAAGFGSAYNAGVNGLNTTFGRTAVAQRISTPYGVAIQENSTAALNVKLQIQRGGIVYKGGVLGRSGISNSQFLATENPLNSGYANRYGIPIENTNFNFIITGKVRSDASFITRSSPGVSTNIGGGIEAVINPGDILIESFYMP